MGVTPRYEQARFDEYMGGTLILSPTGESGSFVVYQDVKLWRYQLDGKQIVSLDKGRAYWLQVAKGSVVISGEQYQAGDAAAIINESEIIAQSGEFAEFLLFDLPR